MRLSSGKVIRQLSKYAQEIDDYTPPDVVELEGSLPNYWDEEGVRHIVVWEDDNEYEFVKQPDGSYKLEKRIPF